MGGRRHEEKIQFSETPCSLTVKIRMIQDNFDYVAHSRYVVDIKTTYSFLMVGVSEHSLFQSFLIRIFFSFQYENKGLSISTGKYIIMFCSHL